MHKLNLPSYQFKLKNSKNKRLIFDNIRKKYVVLTPEEWVRQHVVIYLSIVKKYPISRIAVEKQVQVHGLNRRFDILVFNRDGSAHIIVECKAPTIEITQDTFDQIARYNLSLDSNFLMVTNGLQHYFCKMDKKNKSYLFLEEIPIYTKDLG